MANAEVKSTRTAEKAPTAFKKNVDEAATDAKSSFKAAADATAASMKDMTDAAFSYPRFEVPEMFRSIAEQGLNQTRDAYTRVKAATEEAGGMLEESFEATRENLKQVQFKALDAVKENTDATLEMVRKLMTVSTLADAVQIQTAFARERFEAMVDYSKDVQSTLSKASAEAVKPAKALLDRTVNSAKAAA